MEEIPAHIVERIIRTVSEQLGVKPEEVVPEADFVENLGAGSLDTIELVMALEEEFKTEIPDEDVERMRKVKDVIAYFQKKASDLTKGHDQTE